MKTIVITGPSASGKSYLASKIANNFKYSLVIKTDSYYRDNIFIKILSKLILSIYDRIISIKKIEIIRTIESISKKEKYIKFYSYDFKKRRSSHEIKEIEINNDNMLIILEGIFAHRLNIDYNKTINIRCNGNKEICYERRIRRDKLERGENEKEVNNKFDKSWILYNRYINKYMISNQVYEVNPFNRISYKKLITKLNNDIIKKKPREVNYFP